MFHYAQMGLSFLSMPLSFSRSDSCLSSFVLSLPPDDDRSDREVPIRKKGRPKKKKDAKKKDKDGKPPKTKKRKKIVRCVCGFLFSGSVLALVTCLFLASLQDSDVERNSDRERDYGENSDSAASDYGSGEKKKKKKHKEKKERKTKKKKKDDGDRDSGQEETTKVKIL